MFKPAFAGLSDFHIEVLNMKNHYETLGVSPRASSQEIKSAYRRIAARTHPDTHPNDAAAIVAFKKANEAYTILANASRREQYDRARAPTASVPDLFLRRQGGREFLETVLPSAPAAYQRGADECLVLEAPPADGKMKLSFSKPGSEAIASFEVALPAEARSWLKLERCGAIGRNGGKNGDLYVCLLPNRSAPAKVQKKNKTTTRSGRRS